MSDSNDNNDMHLSLNDNEDYDNANASDEDERAKAGLNSPKPKPNPVAALNLGSDSDDDQNQSTNNDDNNQSNNHLGLEIDENDNDGNVTPNTKRDQMGVNSPRAKKQESGQWTQIIKQVNKEDDDDNNNNNNAGGGGGGGGIESLVTQVARPPQVNQNQNVITQVPRDENTDKTEQEMQKKVGGNSFCDCLAYCFMCCSSSPNQKQPIGMNDMNGNGKNQNSNASQNYNNNNNNNTMNNATNNNTMNNDNNNNKKKPYDNKRLLTSSNNEEDGNNTSKDDKKNVSEDSDDSDTNYDVSLLPPLSKENIGKKCLVLDLDETLVHSSFKPIPKPDFIIPVEIDRVVHHVYVLKRPYVDEFLLRVSKHYEIVVFTASLSKYADPLLDKLDIHNVISHRLFRESCVIHGTAYVKDLRKLGRKLKNSIIVDNSPPSYLFQPTNAVPITSWFDDPRDTQLLDFCPVLETTLKDIDDVRKVLDANNKTFRWLCNQANKPLELFE